MYLSGSSLVVTVFCGPLFALVGGTVVAWFKNLAVGGIAGIAGLVAGLVVGYVLVAWLERDERISEERAEEYFAREGKSPDVKEWPAPIATTFGLAVLFVGAITALVATLVAGGSWTTDSPT